MEKGFAMRWIVADNGFVVRPEEGLFFVADLASSNGTTIEGVVGRISRRELRDGDLIRAGGIIFLFVRPD